MTRVEIEVPSEPQVLDLLFDWQHDVERLARETQAAVDRRKSDQWVLAEAECTLDLIGAELVAVRGSRKAGAQAVASTIVRLERWHAKVERLVAKLQSLPD